LPLSSSVCSIDEDHRLRGDDGCGYADDGCGYVDDAVDTVATAVDMVMTALDILNVRCGHVTHLVRK
jgi:hypothetical protein